LEASRPQNHVHASWQPYKTEQGIVFPTAAEAAYHALLGNKMADCVLQIAKTTSCSSSQGAETTEQLDDQAEQLDDQVEQLDDQVFPCKRPRITFKYGVWHSPEEFLKKAMDFCHPMDNESALHPVTKQAVQKVVNTCPTKLAKERLAAVFKTRKMSTELGAAENELKASMHPDVRRCVQTKNIVLFERLLLHFDFWDMDVVNLLKHGIHLVGLQPSPNGCQKQLVPASMTEDELFFQTAMWRQQGIRSGSRCLTQLEESALINATAGEVEKGLLQDVDYAAAMVIEIMRASGCPSVPTMERRQGNQLRQRFRPPWNYFCA